MSATGRAGEACAYGLAAELTHEPGDLCAEPGRDHEAASLLVVCGISALGEGIGEVLEVRTRIGHVDHEAAAFEESEAQRQLVTGHTAMPDRIGHEFADDEDSVLDASGPSPTRQSAPGMDTSQPR